MSALVASFRAWTHTRFARYAGLIILGCAAAASSVFQPTADFFQFILSVVFVLLACRLIGYDGSDRALQWFAIGFVCIGVLVRTIPETAALRASDALIAQGLLFVIASLVIPLLTRSRMTAYYGAIQQRLQQRASSTAPAVASQMDVRLVFLVGTACATIYALLNSVPLGASDGQVIWTFHFLAFPLQKLGAGLSDPLAAMTNVAVPDSPALTIGKLLLPGAWPGAVTNLISVAGIVCFIAGAYAYLRLFVANQAAVVVAVALFLFTAIGYPLRFAAPFDLGLPLLIAAAVATRKTANWSVPFVAASFLIGILNAADGCELAILVLAIRFMPDFADTPRKYGLYAIAGLAGSVAGAFVLAKIGAGMSLRQDWWFTNELPRIMSSEGLDPLAWESVLLAVLAVCGISVLFTQKRTATLAAAGVLFVASAICAIPVHYGVIPIISPADLLGLLFPQGWPSARFAEMALFALLVPAAATLELILNSARRTASPSGRSFSGFLYRFVIVVAGLAMLGGTCRIAYSRQTDPLYGLERNARVVFYPLAQPGSYAGVLYASESLAAGRPLLQQPVYASAPVQLQVNRDPVVAAGNGDLQRLHADYLVVNLKLYNDPRTRTEYLELYDVRDSQHPSFDGAAGVTLEAFTRSVQILRVTP